mmetsp:Transcript_55571/g.110377  ORF Transcript_55571/g.110377 Transcript_55571/m.110377 type:complete len:273 (-) Transcript_55571:53-871(-)
MPYDGNGNFIETCGDMCISNRFAKDSGKAAGIVAAPPTLCGFGCGGYAGPDSGGVCARCIKEKGLHAIPIGVTSPVDSGLRPVDLVELDTLDPTLVLDIKYATPDNFMGRVLYPEARAFLQRPAAEALVRVHAALAPCGLGLVVFDAYRPASVTQAMWDETPEAQRIFVANPAKGSKHNRGCAVDVTLFNRATGARLPMPSAFDEFTERAFSDYAGGAAPERLNRARLKTAMWREGFTVNPKEWWHFDYRLWEQYPLLDVPFPPRRGLPCAT